MKITVGRVNWRDRWVNRPVVELLIDRICRLDEFVFTEREGFYYAEKDGEARFFLDNSNGSGFGGRTFKLNMSEGARTIKGPWGSRASVANQKGFGPCIDVVVTDNQKGWNKGNFSMCSCAINLIKNFKNVFIGGGIYSVGGFGEDFKFPCNSSFTLAKYVRLNGEIVYEPAVRLPDGGLWLKPGLDEEISEKPEDIFKGK